MTHKFQTAWYDEDVESAYLTQIEAWVHAGDLDMAAECLLDDMEGIDTPLIDMCRNLTEESVEISGWEEIGDAIAAFEGEEISAVHILMSNDNDLVFEDKTTRHEPIVDLAFYSDKNLAFSSLSKGELLSESLKEDPLWFGVSEDIEVYLEIDGLGALNTELLRHKRQYYFRDSAHVLDAAEGLADNIVPISYIEYRLAAMLRAVRYHQALKTLLDEYGMYKEIPLIAGMYNMRLDIASVYIPKTSKIIEFAKTPKLSVTIKRNMQEYEPVVIGSSLRKNLTPEPEKKPGFLRRLFGRKAA